MVVRIWTPLVHTSSPDFRITYTGTDALKNALLNLCTVSKFNSGGCYVPRGSTLSFCEGAASLRAPPNTPKATTPA